MKLTKRATGINFSRKTTLTAKATASQPASKRKTMAETKHKRHTHSFILCAFLSFLLSLALFFSLLSRSLCSFLNPLLFRCLCICCLKETVQHCCSLASSLFDRIALIFLWVSARASLVRHSLYFISHMRLKTHAQELFTLLCIRFFTLGCRHRCHHWHSNTPFVHIQCFITSIHSFIHSLNLNVVRFPFRTSFSSFAISPSNNNNCHNRFTRRIHAFLTQVYPAIYVKCVRACMSCCVRCMTTTMMTTTTDWAFNEKMWIHFSNCYMALTW